MEAVLPLVAAALRCLTQVASPKEALSKNALSKDGIGGVSIGDGTVGEGAGCGENVNYVPELCPL